MCPNNWHPQWRENKAAILLALWWAIFAAFSFYWAAGGLWLVDTAVEKEGQELARQRPFWLIVLLIITGVFKLLFIVFGYLLVAPIGRRVPRFLYLLAGWGIGIGCIAYGVFFSVHLVPFLFSGQMTQYRLLRLVLWMPQFWFGGLLMVLATLRFQVVSRRASR